MKLQTKKLIEGENTFDFSSQKDGWVQEVVSLVGKQGYKLLSPLEVHLKLTKLEPDYYMKGKLDFVVEQSCSRCADPFKFPIHQEFDIALAQLPNVKVRGSEITDEVEELDINFFEGNEIDLSPIVSEQFFLSIPYQVVCKEGCKGICQQCGQNLNEKTCNCTDPLISPFSVLENLKL